MLNISPSENIYLCNIGLYNDYKNILTFSNKSSQLNYFNSIWKKHYVNYTFVREESAIYVEDNIEDLRKFNYLFFQNSKFTDKWIYCFITNMEYENENTTKLYVELDVFSTWQFDIKYKKCFVEREHVTNDTIGAHTIPENLELGEFVCNGLPIEDTNNGDFCYVLGSLVDYEGRSYPACTYNGLPTGLQYFRSDTLPGLKSLVNSLNQVAHDNDAILLGFLAPKWLAPIQSASTIEESIVPAGYSFEVSAFTSLDGYTPRNKKLFTHPYCYYLMTNGANGSAIYKNEYFSSPNGTKEFYIRGALCPGCSISLYPNNYKNIQKTLNSESLTLGKFPQFAWNKQPYYNWFESSGLNSAFGMDIPTLVNGLGTGAALSTINPLIGGAAASLSISAAVTEYERRRTTPPQMQGNSNSGDLMSVANCNNFVCYKMSITSEYAKIIDDYFTIHGYKVNAVKVPNVNTRSNFNYVKTINANMDGDIPNEDLVKIRSIFDSGVTIWHSPSGMYNYGI